MAVAAAARTRMTPLTLRDFLEQSSSEGFRSYPRFPAADDGGVGDLAPPVRLLIEAGLRRSPSRSPSFYSFFHKSPGTLSKISRLSRSLSRRFRGGFLRRREDGDDEEDDIDVDERDSFGLPSPVVSSCSSSEWERAESSCTELATTTEEGEEEKCASEYEKTSQSSTGGSIAFHGAADAGGDGHKEEVDGEPVGCNLEMEDKPQLSPVSVMDFPYDDDDEDDDHGEEGSDPGGMCSPSFQQCLAELQRSKAELLHKIRRLEKLKTQVVVPVDLEAQFTESDSGLSHDACTERTNANTNSTSDDTATTTTAPATPRSGGERQCTDDDDQDDGHGAEQQQHGRLLARLLESVAVVAKDEITEWLLLDFFAEGVDRLRAAGKPISDREEAVLLRAAGEWARGAGQQWGVGDVVFSGWAAVADMERSRRWMCVAEERQDAGAEVEGLVMDALVDELVDDLRGAGAAAVGPELHGVAGCNVLWGR
ncbi:uncharacterized protein LOC102714719 [Oryza brachyantha]|uniref:uncharacterized protein LOC102714719 n=1 Tax=Oryza brachyantha TaxID=4533 RepID=UPI001ADAD86E|nr:uncharacterized protein LOC102714719 [Oryza brachyantha]